MVEELILVLLAVFGYVLGAIPFGILVSKAIGPSRSTHGRQQKYWIHQCLARFRHQSRDPYASRRLGQRVAGELGGDAVAHHGVLHDGRGAFADLRPYVLAVPRI